MFRASSEPLLLSEAGIHALCVSMNTPVVNTDELPVGPARASIVVYDDGYGTPCLGVGVRSLEGRQTALYVYAGVLDIETSAEQALAQAQRYAEGMGFLFDDDVVASGGRSRALELWVDLMGDAYAAEPEADGASESSIAPALSASSVPPEDEWTDSEELVLDEPLELATPGSPGYGVPAEPVEPATSGTTFALDESDEPIELASEPDRVDRVDRADRPAPAAPAVASSRPTRQAAPPLSKFRQPPRPAAEPPAGEGAAGSGSALGRIAIVRRRAEGGRAAWIFRVLGSF